MEAIKNVEAVIKSNLDPILQNPYVMAVLKISLILYAAQIAPRLPNMASATLQNTFVKIAAIALTAYIAEVDFQLAIILAIIFVIGINVSAGRGFFESYENMGMMEDQGPFYADQTKYQTLLQKPAVVGNAVLLDSYSDSYSACDNIKMADLLAVFDNDHLKLQNTVMYAYKELANKLPKDSDAMTNLVKMVKAVGAPGNIQFTDASAPILATILINAGFVINDKCRAPYQDGLINQ
jgi:hypothetical protein